MFFLPIFPFKKTKKCQRCGLNYPKNEDKCPHCSVLTSDSDLEDLLRQKESETQGNQNLGLMFLIIGGVIAFCLILLFL